MQRIFPRFLDLLFENSCLICNKSSGQNPICKLCDNDFIIRNERNNIHLFNEITVYSWGFYDGKLRDGIIALKAGKRKLANYFGNKLIDFWKSLPEKIRSKNYLVIPVPSHKKRIKERGFCQTSLISKYFAEHFKLNLLTNFVIRNKQTKFMNSLNNINERRENIKNAFEIINPINVKDILVIDDILTSGSTLSEITKTIHKVYPNTNVLGLTVAAGDRFN